MISLALPDYDADEFYLMCARRTRRPNLRQLLISEDDRVRQRAVLYIEKAQREELYTLEEEDALHVTKQELRDLYGRVLVRGSKRGVYDKLRSRSLFKRCPLCAQRDVQTLDHYLPESLFPEFAVFPPNLVPSCLPCNKAKLAHSASNYDEQTFHPYFDGWDEYQLLTADVEIDNAVDVKFSVARPSGFARRGFLRVRFHFERLRLNELYSEHAALELVQKKQVFLQTFSSGGASALREELEIEARARSTPFINSWQPVLYRALSQSDEFCSGGFDLIES